jgi:small subunit ribosomal protein S1
VSEALDELYEEEDERPSSFGELERKMRLEGTVTRTELAGAFVDIGVEVEGFIHISQLSAQRVNRVSEVVGEGDQVTVWVKSVDKAHQRVELSMIEPPAVDWQDLRPGQVYTGTVKRLERFGAFVDIGATRDGLVHVSEITSGYIRDPKDHLKPGDEVQVKVLNVDRKRRRIELSMKAIEEHLVVEEDDVEEDEAPTTMEVAWRQAQAERRERRRERSKKERSRQDDGDIFSRTLRLRGDED